MTFGLVACGDSGGDGPPGSVYNTPNSNNSTPQIPTPLAPNPGGGGVSPTANPTVVPNPAATTVSPTNSAPPAATTADPVVPVAPATTAGPAVAPPVATTATPAPVAPDPTPTVPAQTSTPAVEPDPPATTDDTQPQGNPDADAVIPQSDTGWFPANSNQYGFQGSWYCFDDGELDTSCVTDEPPWVEGEGMCLTGSTIVDDTYAAWGAGIGASLNDDDGTKLPFDAEGAGITGFKFTITGDLGGATLKFMLPLTSKESEDGPPEYTAKVGANSVTFDDVVRPAWADEDQEAANAGALYELKWQIAGGEVEAEYDFCVTDVEPL